MSDIERPLPMEETEVGGRLNHSSDDKPSVNCIYMTMIIICSVLLFILGGVLDVLILIFYAAGIFTYSLVALFAYPLLLIIMLSLPSKLIAQIDSRFGDEAVERGLYDQARHMPRLIIRILRSSGALHPRCCLLMLLWLVLNLCVVRFKNLTLLGSPLWKWSLLAVTLTCAYYLAFVLYHMPSHLTNHIRLKHHRGYFYKGLRPSGILVIYSSMLLVSWLFYFRTEDGLNHPFTRHPQAFQYVTLSCVSLFVGSVLWLLKAFLLLQWSAGAIYNRFQPRILIAGVKYAFLGCLVERFWEGDIITSLGVNKIQESKPTFGAAKYIMSRKMECSHLVYIGRILTSLAELAASQDDDGASYSVHSFDTISQSESNRVLDGLSELLDKLCRTNNQATLEDRVKRTAMHLYNTFTNPKSVFIRIRRDLMRLPNLNINEEQRPRGESETVMADLLNGLVLEDISSDEGRKESQTRKFTLDELKKWMADGHKECVNMGRTLADAGAIVTRLDIFLSCVIFGATILMWLMITGVATTAVLVTIATPLLALTFIFGDTTKAFFQGLVFCFATQAFDVGDRCLLDETELEVKSLSILTTTFVKIGTREIRLYPNSVLATKAIVNLGWQPDPSDVVEFTLNPSINIKKLEDYIIQYFDENKRLYKGSHELLFQEVGDNFKVFVYFTHVLTVSDLTHSQCFRKKREQRSHFVKDIKLFLTETQKGAEKTD